MITKVTTCSKKEVCCVRSGPENIGIFIQFEKEYKKQNNSENTAIFAIFDRLLFLICDNRAANLLCQVFINVSDFTRRFPSTQSVGQMAISSLFYGSTRDIIAKSVKLA